MAPMIIDRVIPKKRQCRCSWFWQRGIIRKKRMEDWTRFQGGALVAYVILASSVEESVVVWSKIPPNGERLATALLFNAVEDADWLIRPVAQPPVYREYKRQHLLQLAQM